MERLGESELAGRHPGVVELLSFFDAAHLPDDLREVSEPCGELAHHLVAVLPDGPELTAGLRKLLEAKDCAVRQAIRARITREAGPWVAPNARDAVAGGELEREGVRDRLGGLPCCGGPHTAQERNPRGHAVDCINYGEGAEVDADEVRTLSGEVLKR